MIDPEFQELYYWDFEDQGDKVKVSFNCDITIKRDSFKLNFDPEKNTLSLTFMDKIPIILGTLFGKAKSVNNIPLLNQYILEIEKEENIKWPILIIKPVPETNEIDPHSAFELVYLVTSDQNYQNEELKLGELLKFSAGAGYLPAIQGAIQTFIHEPGKRDVAIEYMQVAADVYQNPTSIFELGIYLFESDTDREKAVVYLHRAYDIGQTIAAIYLGLAYSPLSEYSFQNKDATMAFKYFSEVLDAGSPVVYHEIAKLYASGQGVPQDKEKADQYQKNAKELDPAIPDLPEFETKSEDKNDDSSPSLIDVGISAAATVTGAAALFYLAYKFIKK